jgi:DNA-binding response OmpR family regulator
MSSEATAEIVVVDDEADLREAVAGYLSRQGLSVRAASGGAELRAMLAERPADAVILDIAMPGEDGLSIARALRSQGDIGIVMLTAAADVVDRVVRLEVGADDYIAKPFNPRELLARVRAVLRRARRSAEPPGRDDEIRFGPFSLNLASHQLSRDGEPVPLTSGEFDLLAVLAAHPNKVLHRDRILDLLTGAERSPFDRSIDVRVTRLRGKIEQDPSRPAYIRTIWGKGYMFCPDGNG